MKNHSKVTREQLVEARDLFGNLLGRRTTEADWQRFFTRYPYVLSATLPLSLRPDHIIPMARPGKADPDFILYPWDTAPVPFYGVVELKRPDSSIITKPRSNITLLTRDAETAIAQGKIYVEEVGRRLRNADRHLLCLGNEAYVFIIMGLRAEISEKLGEKIFREQIDGRFPKNVQLLPYDTVFERFDARIPARVRFIAPSIRVPDEKLEELMRDLDDEEMEDWQRRACG